MFRRRALSMLVIIAMIGTVFTVTGTSNAIAAFAGGDGSEGNPYQIANVNQLQDMRDDLLAHYILVNDIDASETSSWAGGQGFQPIASDRYFKGSFDGKGYTISDLFINRLSGWGIGLFGRVYDTTVKNVHLENVDLTSNGFSTGGLVGEIMYGSISNSSVTGNIRTISSSRVGGLVGQTDDTSISNCWVRVSVSGSVWVGGLVGMQDYGEISESYSRGSVDGESTVGGLAGTSDGFISNSFSHSTVNAVSGDAGGLVADISSSTVISNSYSIGRVDAGRNAGGLIGSSVPEDPVYDSYWDNETSGQTTSEGGTGKNTTEMKQQSTYAGWDFVNIWRILEDVTYPYFWWANEPPVADLVADPEIGFVADAIDFDGSASVDPDGTLVKYEWDFDDDGIYDYQETQASAPDGAFDGKTQYTYTEFGFFTSTLRVTDNGEENSTARFEIKIIEHIFIRPDGLITDDEFSELTPPISKKRSTYTLEGDIYASIHIQKDRIEIDGNYYNIYPPASDYNGYDITLFGNVDQVTIKNVTINDFSHGIHVNPIADGSKIDTSNIIIGNTFNSNEQAIHIENANYNEILGNEINCQVDSYGIYLEHSDYITVIGNAIENKDGSTAIYINSGGFNEIINNTIDNDVHDEFSFAYGISMVSSSNNQIIKNKILNYQYGIRLDNSNDNVIFRNILLPNSLSTEGIQVISSNNNHITGNAIDGNLDCKGISLYGANDNKIKRNSVVHAGLALYIHSSDGNTIIDNILIGDLYISTAIGLVTSDSNNISANAIFRFNIGLRLDAARDNRIHLNNIFNIDDKEILVITLSINKWNSSFGEGGYWGHYTGADDGSGGRIPGDGIGDTELPHNDVDEYPLMHHFMGYDTEYLKNATSKVVMPPKIKDSYHRLLNRARKFIDAGKTRNAIRVLESFIDKISKTYEYPHQSYFTIPQADQLILGAQDIIDELNYPI